MKKCSRCKNDKPLDDFRNSKRFIDGKFHTCKTCMNLYHEKDYSENKQKFLDINQVRRLKWREFFYQLKLKSSCKDCGETHIATLEYHHLNKEEKEFNITGHTKYFFNEKRKEEVLNEISKCVVLCSNCHKKRHFIEGNYYNGV